MNKSIINSEKWSKTIIETSPDAIIVTDLEGNIIECNQAALDISVFNLKEELIGFNGLNAIYPDDRERIKKDIKNLLLNGVVKDIEYKILNKKGKVFPVEISASVIFDDFNKPYAFICILKDITKRKKTEEKLKENEQWFRSVIDTSPSLLVILNTQCEIDYVSPNSKEITGYTPEEIAKKIWMHDPDEISRLQELFDEAFVMGKGSKSVEYKSVKKNGDNWWASITSRPINDEKGEFKGFVVQIFDITEYKKMEQDLKDAYENLEIKVNERFKTVMDSLDASVYVADLETYEILFVNKYAQKTLGDVKGKKCWESIQSGQNGPCPFCTNKKLLDEAGNPAGVYVWEFQNTITKRWYECRDSAIRWIDGRLVRMEIATDITKRKELENKSIKRSEKLNILNKIIVTANRSVSVESLLRDVLTQTMNSLPFDSGEIYLIDKEKGIAKIFHSKGNIGSYDTIKIHEQPHKLIYINGKSAFRNDLDKVTLDISTESRLKSIAIVPIFSEGEIIGSLGLASKKKHYFTEEEKELIKTIGNEIGNVIGKLIAEEERAKLIEELKRSNEELEQFAYITSHDLQEPLRTIASFTQLLERRYKGQLDSNADEFIEFIVDSSIRMKAMIQGLLDYSRIGKDGVEFNQVNLEDTLEEVLSNLKAITDESNAEITWDKLPEVIGDSKLMVQLFQNIIGNAIKFRKPDQNPKIHISFLKNRNGDGNVFCVEDNGIGIDQQFADRIFKVFKRLHTVDEYKGTGIGLATCRRIAEYHGGHIWVESKLNEGSKFYFTLQP